MAAALDVCACLVCRFCSLFTLWLSLGAWVCVCALILGANVNVPRNMLRVLPQSTHAWKLSCILTDDYVRVRPSAFRAYHAALKPVRLLVARENDVFPERKEMSN